MRFRHKPTDIEQTVMRALDELGIRYIYGYPTRIGFVLDFYLPDFNIDLEADGPMHDLPKNRKRDGFRSHLLKERLGLRTVRLSHRDIYGKEIGEIKQLIRGELWRASE